MRASAVSMSKHFGMLGKVFRSHFLLQMYGEYRFALAPNEQKAFKGFFDQAIVKVIKRVGVGAFSLRDFEFGPFGLREPRSI
ncbi:unnamed protein product [Heligmosomoides polygyrus]|uniref:Cytochrome b-c1 complex subunit 8 n=1 Tax=Heligmosomoides polygyrus TaxID=6339 RepID=A0A183FW69_HELPZ|nr:unnamed protein product [Heligmosomoides polygyrus]